MLSFFFLRILIAMEWSNISRKNMAFKRGGVIYTEREGTGRKQQVQKNCEDKVCHHESNKMNLKVVMTYDRKTKQLLIIIGNKMHCTHLKNEGQTHL